MNSTSGNKATTLLPEVELVHLKNCITDIGIFAINFVKVHQDYCKFQKKSQQIILDHGVKHDKFWTYENFKDPIIFTLCGHLKLKKYVYIEVSHNLT